MNLQLNRGIVFDAIYDIHLQIALACCNFEGHARTQGYGVICRVICRCSIYRVLSRNLGQFHVIWDQHVVQIQHLRRNIELLDRMYFLFHVKYGLAQGCFLRAY